MFGVPLEVLRLREQSTVPALVIRTVDRILALCRKLENPFHGLEAPPAPEVLEKLRKGSTTFDISTLSGPEALNLLSHFLIHLPEGVLPMTLTPLFLASLEHGDQKSLKEVVEKLDDPRQHLLDYLTWFAAEVDGIGQAHIFVDFCSWFSRNVARTQEVLSDTYVKRLMGWRSSVFHNVNAHQQVQEHPPTRLGVVTKLSDIAKWPFHRTSPNTRGTRILALDGGGMRGLFSLAILEVICKTMFGDCGTESTRKFVSCFDIICGTSTGGIIAVGLACGHSLEEIRETYLAVGKDIFSSPVSFLYSPMRYLRYTRTGDYYSGYLLEQLFSNKFGTNSFQSLPPKIFVTSTDASKEIWQPLLIRSYDNTQSQFDGLKDVPVPTALRATSAAPTYFSNVALDQRILIDGGCVANNPAEIAIFEAHHLWPLQPIEMVLSVGTGVPSNNAGSVNIIGLVNSFIDITTNSELVHQRILEWINLEQRPIHYTRFSPTSGLGSIPLDCANIALLEDGENKSRVYMADPPQQAAIEALRPFFAVAQR